MSQSSHLRAEPRPLWRSLTLQGAAAMAVAYAAGRLGLPLSDAAAGGIAETLVDLLFNAGLIAVGVGRARARAPLS